MGRQTRCHPRPRYPRRTTSHPCPCPAGSSAPRRPVAVGRARRQTDRHPNRRRSRLTNPKRRHLAPPRGSPRGRLRKDPCRRSKSNRRSTPKRLLFARRRSSWTPARTAAGRNRREPRQTATRARARSTGQPPPAETKPIEPNPAWSPVHLALPRSEAGACAGRIGQRGRRIRSVVHDCVARSSTRRRTRRRFSCDDTGARSKR
mmetsp:Transcript_8800/g.39938  ORF Transcript_8800/g.39938 Transcript_8800/m.39938 type:complete len:204 (-) Transcript_8800:807-1418(-)